MDFVIPFYTILLLYSFIYIIEITFTNSLRTRKHSLPPRYDSSYISEKLMMLANIIPAFLTFSEYLHKKTLCFRIIFYCKN